MPPSNRDDPRAAGQRRAQWLKGDDIARASAAMRGRGAYAMQIALCKSLDVMIAGHCAGTLPKGTYIYCGSAKGAGGFRSRLGRHVRRGKTIRWHVDQLTEHGIFRGVWIFPGGEECDVVAALSHLPVPIPGFGSTDCRQCRSHLLAWSDEPLPWI